MSDRGRSKCNLGAYLVTATLTVVSCLHRHASLDSMREVETFQPLARTVVIAQPRQVGKTLHDSGPRRLVTRMSWQHRAPGLQVRHPEVINATAITAANMPTS